MTFPRKCWTYSGPASTDWAQGPCNQNPPPTGFQQVGNCGTVGSGTCCYWRPGGSGSVVESETLDYQIQHCEGDGCEGEKVKR